ncbi:WXG100 family type VII secretion target [Actinoalloteichus spitiensis]|uniref:WXG100 family type VII secretion target n=1 Tax=Actinoalloteichus spitiensis TaxID=252394 RepID=UPI00037D0502|nr:WXG100 family type VII secretion target [Actinoalloteichus spitiensis]
MSDGYRADTTALRSAAPRFSGAADELRDALSRLQGALDSAGACWGGDDPGTGFGNAYQPAEQEATQAFTTFADGLENIRTNLDASAEQWDADDLAAERAFDRQSEGLGY